MPRDSITRRVDQAVDALDVPAAGIGGFEFVGQRRMVARIDTATTRQRDGGGGHQGEDRIEPGGNRKLRQIHQRAPRPVQHRSRSGYSADNVLTLYSPKGSHEPENRGANGSDPADQY